MKRLMLGNDAVARGLYEAGCSLVSSYPGTPSTEVTEAAAKYDEIYCEWAPNEKVAMEVALGAAIAGKRSCCAMKHVGLNVAADPLFTASYTGINAGMIIVVADDPGMHSSQNEQDSRHYAMAAKLPMLEPSDSQECLDFVEEAYRLSEEYDTPVLLKLCTRISHSQSLAELSDRREVPPRSYERNAVKFVMVPGNAIQRHPVVEQRMAALANLTEVTPLNRIEWGGRDVGIITSSTCYQYAKEVFGDSVSVLKLGLIHPLPVKLLREFAAGVKQLVVLEELDGVIEDHCRALGLNVSGKDRFPILGEFSQNLVAENMGQSVPASQAFGEPVPIRPPVMCPGCPHRGIFHAISKHKIAVSGDIGCYTLGYLAPLNAMDTTICMGASISALHGRNKALGAEGEHRSVAVLGDSTFMHSGMTGLVNIAYNGSNSTVIILDNSTTGMTGHQQNPTTGYNIKGDPAAKVDLEALCRALGIPRVRVVDPYDLKACETALLEELAAAEASVIISRRPCALLKSVRPQPALTVDRDACRGCGACMKLGCPALSLQKGKAAVDPTLCVGCGMCQHLCSFDAFSRKEGN